MPTSPGEVRRDSRHLRADRGRRERGSCPSTTHPGGVRARTGARAARQRLLWRARQDSNLRPSAPEADALSTELQARGADHTGSCSRRPSACGFYARIGDPERPRSAVAALPPAGRFRQAPGSRAAFGMRATSRVPPPLGLTISSVPLIAARRSARPRRPLPSVGSAPPTPSSTISTVRWPSRNSARTVALVALAYFAILASASDTVK